MIFSVVLFSIRRLLICRQILLVGDNELRNNSDKLLHFDGLWNMHPYVHCLLHSKLLTQKKSLKLFSLRRSWLLSNLRKTERSTSTLLFEENNYVKVHGCHWHLISCVRAWQHRAGVTIAAKDVFSKLFVVFFRPASVTFLYCVAICVCKRVWNT